MFRELCYNLFQNVLKIKDSCIACCLLAGISFYAGLRQIKFEANQPSVLSCKSYFNRHNSQYIIQLHSLNFVLAYIRCNFIKSLNLQGFISFVCLDTQLLCMLTSQKL